VIKEAVLLMDKEVTGGACSRIKNFNIQEGKFSFEFHWLNLVKAIDRTHVEFPRGDTKHQPEVCLFLLVGK
jgi:hypothetical protein